MSQDAFELVKSQITHPEKLFWPKEGYTKGDLAAYYVEVAPYILPYLKNRPIILHRFPDGIEGSHFYQKNLEHHPEGIATTLVIHEGKTLQYLLIDSLKSLLYAINLGSIDLHPFLSRTGALERPDYCVIDLDPHGVPFENVIEAALELHALLEKIGATHLCKTSGGNGLHIMLPLHARYTFEQSKEFAERICSYLHSRLPKTTSLERKPEKRENKIYLDCLQNRYGQSIVAPYAVRPRPKAKVSTPLLWKEVDSTLNVEDYTIETVPLRLKKMGDIFTAILGAGIDLEKAMQKLSIDGW